MRIETFSKFVSDGHKADVLERLFGQEVTITLYSDKDGEGTTVEPYRFDYTPDAELLVRWTQEDGYDEGYLFVGDVQQIEYDI